MEQFSIADYIVFSVMLLISAAIGIFYGCGFGGGKKTAEEYLLGSRSMSIGPVAVSYLVSIFSGISLLGMPSEIYTYGVQYYLAVFSFTLMCGITVVIFVPMFRQLNLTSFTEYLERRFSVSVRLFGSALFILQYCLYLPVVLYAPSLALEAGIPLYVSILATGVVCTFYTSVGGMKAVIWTDVFQSLVMLAGMVTVAIQGSIEVGGIDKVWQINKERGRLNFFEFNPDPRVRHTFWGLVFGSAIQILPLFAITQPAVQRIVAVKTFQDAKRVVWLNVPLSAIVVTLCCLDGLVIFAVYASCDLKRAGMVQSNDQVLPYFIVDKLGYLKGVPGLFTACLYAGSLSTASSALNAIALVILEDFVKKRVPNIKESTATAICKVVAIVFGVIITGLAFVVKYLGTLILQLAYSLFGMVMSQLTGCFILGMFFPRANSKGAFAGGISGLAVSFWIVVGSKIYPGNLRPGDVSIQGCSNFNASTTNSTGIFTNQWKPHTGVPLAHLYSVSYLWLSTISILVFLTVAMVVSIVTENKDDKSNREKLDPKLLFPLKDWLLSFFPGHILEWDMPDREPLELSPREVRVNNDYDIGVENAVREKEDLQVTSL